MFEAAAVGSLLAGGPVVAILGMVYNVIILGPTGFLGSAVFILFYPAMVSEPFCCVYQLFLRWFTSSAGLESVDLPEVLLHFFFFK